MNIVNKLTYRHLKSKLKRSVITLMGIIISVAMVAAVFTSVISFLDFFKNISNTYDGSYYSVINECNYDNIDTLTKRDDVESVSACQSIGSIDVDLNSKSERNRGGVLSVNNDFYDMFHLKLTDGRIPQNENEVVVTKSFISKNHLNWTVGSQINADYCSYSNETEEFTKKAYTIVGITDAATNQTDNNSFFTYLNKDTAKNITIYVRNTKLNNSIWDTMKGDAQSIGKDDVSSYNTEYFCYSGVLKDNGILAAMGVFAGIILTIIIIASVFMIYDSFAVSYQQRARYLGMLASVGATRHQKRSSIYFEGFLLGIIGIPVGIISGIGGIAVTFKAIEPLMEKTLGIQTDEILTVHVNWIVVVFSILISAITIFISAYIPARRASKTTAIEAIRQSNTVTVSSRKLKKSRLAGKMFGYEGALASKNYKRNGKRSRSITSALALSVVLFLTVTSFSSMLTSTINDNYGMPNYDIYVSAPMKYSDKLEKEFDSIPSSDGYLGSSLVNAAIQDNDKYIDEKNKVDDENVDQSQILIYGLDDERFNEYATSIGVDAKDYYNKKNPKGIMINRATYANVDGKKRLTVSPYKNVENQTLVATYDKNSKNENEFIKCNASLTIGKQTTKEATDYVYSSNVSIVYPFSTLPSVVPEIADTEELIATFGVTATDHESAAEDIEDFMSANEIGGTSFDQTSQMQAMNALNTIAQVFGYGFITLITLISIMNIINTISTSMEERRREFAMIKSVGLTPKSFKKMIYLESTFYGLKSLLWGIPISLVLNFLMYKALSQSFDYGFTIIWQAYVAAIVAVFLVIGIALIYSTSKIKHDNIIETLKNDDV